MVSEQFKNDTAACSPDANLKKAQTWVQCDRCSKWRRLPQILADSLDEEASWCWPFGVGCFVSADFLFHIFPGWFLKQVFALESTNSRKLKEPLSFFVTLSEGFARTTQTPDLQVAKWHRNSRTKKLTSNWRMMRCFLVIKVEKYITCALRDNK